MRGGSHLKGYHQRLIGLACFWLALRTLTFWAFVETTIGSRKSEAFRRGSEVSQVDVMSMPTITDFRARSGVRVLGFGFGVQTLLPS